MEQLASFVLAPGSAGVAATLSTQPVPVSPTVLELAQALINDREAELARAGVHVTLDAAWLAARVTGADAAAVAAAFLAYGAPLVRPAGQPAAPLIEAEARRFAPPDLPVPPDDRP